MTTFILALSILVTAYFVYVKKEDYPAAAGALGLKTEA